MHVGNVHDWAAEVLRTRVEQPQVFDAEPPDVGSYDELLSWYAARAGALLDLLLGDEVPDDRPVWTFGPPGQARFWARRQAHEVTVHALDAVLATGDAADDALLPLDPVASADGVDEVLTVMVPRVAGFVPWTPLPGVLRIVAADTGDEWMLERDGRIRSGAGDSAPTATLSGPASGLFALLWKRVGLTAEGPALGLDVQGEPSVVAALLAARLTP